jgi:hypothetical protein
MPVSRGGRERCRTEILTFKRDRIAKTEAYFGWDLE